MYLKLKNANHTDCIGDLYSNLLKKVKWLILDHFRSDFKLGSSNCLMYAVYELLIFNLGLSDLFVSFQRLNYGVFRTWYYYLLQSTYYVLSNLDRKISCCSWVKYEAYKIQRELEKSNAKIKRAKILSYHALVVAFGYYYFTCLMDQSKDLEFLSGSKPKPPGRVPVLRPRALFSSKNFLFLK